MTKCRIVRVAATIALLMSLSPSRSSGQTFISAWGGFGTGPGQFQGPHGEGPTGVAVGGSGDVYVVDGSHLQVFTSSGMFLRMWAASSFFIAVDTNDNVYVQEFGNLIRKFSSTGTYLTQWYASSDVASLAAVDRAGNVYVVDHVNASVVVYSDAGAYLREWGLSERWSPGGLAVDAAGNVYVTDSYNHLIQKFANDGTRLTTWDGALAIPVRIAIGPQGYFYVVDNGTAEVKVFTGEGAFLEKWGGYGTAPGEFNNPIGIAIDGAGAIYVADTNNGRIEKFGTGPTAVGGGTWGALKVRYRARNTATQGASRGR